MAKRTAHSDEFQTRSFLQRTRDAVFLLNRKRRLRFGNAAWEHLAGQSLEDSYDLYCTRNAESRLAQALAPPPEVMAGNPARVRRALPKAKFGPPWWEIAFLPLIGQDGLFGIIGRIRVISSMSAVKGRPLPEALLQMRHRLRERYALDSLISHVPTCERLVQQVRLAAQHRMPLMLVGEAGSGKRWLARVIHHHGVTAEQSFLAVDCGGLPAIALPSLIFGDAGLGRPERLGTIYLRDPGRLPQEIQSRLAAWIRERPLDGPRIAAGIVGDLPLANGLAPHLHIALSVQTIAVPPLRERSDDISRLAGLFLERATHAGAPACPGFAPDSLELMREYPWPGNLREFDAAIDSAARHANGSAVAPAHFPEAIRQLLDRKKALAQSPDVRAEAGVPLDTLLEHVERRLIVLAMRKSKGLQAEAAEYLGIWRARLSRRIQALKIREDEWRVGPARERKIDETDSDRGVRE